MKKTIIVAVIALAYFIGLMNGFTDAGPDTQYMIDPYGDIVLITQSGGVTTQVYYTFKNYPLDWLALWVMGKTSGRLQYWDTSDYQPLLHS